MGNVIYSKHYMLRNHSRGPMFVDYQDFVCSMGLGFVGNWFVALKCKIIQYHVINSWGRNSWVSITHEH